jgi:hypothetical protein
MRPAGLYILSTGPTNTFQVVERVVSLTVFTMSIYMPPRYNSLEGFQGIRGFTVADSSTIGKQCKRR